MNRSLRIGEQLEGEERKGGGGGSVDAQAAMVAEQESFDVDAITALEGPVPYWWEVVRALFESCLMSLFQARKGSSTFRWDGTPWRWSATNTRAMDKRFLWNGSALENLVPR